MSIKDYNIKLVLVNGTTNERIKIPQIDKYLEVDQRISVNDILMLNTIKEELSKNEMVTIAKSYMRDS